MRNIQDKKDGETLPIAELNSIIEELQNVVAKAGLIFNPRSTTQLLEAMKMLAGGNSVCFKDVSTTLGHLELTNPAFTAKQLTSNMVFRFKTKNLVSADSNKVSINNAIKDIPIIFKPVAINVDERFANPLKQELYCEGIIRLKDKNFKDSPPNMWVIVVTEPRVFIEQIKKALLNMDVFISIHHRGFSESYWCQQEIGFACARKISSIALIIEEDPKGFISEFQAITAVNKEIKDLVKEIVDYLK